MTCNRSQVCCDRAVYMAYRDMCLTQGYYRGARAALKLGDFEEALQLCRKGMGIDSKSPELQQLSAEAEKRAKVRN